MNKFVPVEERAHRRGTTVSLPDEMHAKLKCLSIATNISMARYIETWVGAGVDYEYENDFPVTNYLNKLALENLKEECGGDDEST